MNFGKKYLQNNFKVLRDQTSAGEAIEVTTRVLKPNVLVPKLFIITKNLYIFLTPEVGFKCVRIGVVRNNKGDLERCDRKVIFFKAWRRNVKNLYFMEWLRARVT